MNLSKLNVNKCGFFYYFWSSKYIHNILPLKIYPSLVQYSSSELCLIYGMCFLLCDLLWDLHSYYQFSKWKISEFHHPGTNCICSSSFSTLYLQNWHQCLSGREVVNLKRNPRKQVVYHTQKMSACLHISKPNKTGMLSEHGSKIKPLSFWDPHKATF